MNNNGILQTCSNLVSCSSGNGLDYTYRLWVLDKIQCSIGGVPAETGRRFMCTRM